MNLDIVSALVNIGSSGAVIIVVVYFLRFIADQRKLDQDSHRNLVVEIRNLTRELVNLRKDFDVAVASMRERTKPRSKELRSSTETK